MGREDVTRRDALRLLAGAGAAAAAGCSSRGTQPTAQSAAPAVAPEPAAEPLAVAVDPVLDSARLGFQWRTRDPFLFCVHHLDHYPAGDERMGPTTSLQGRKLGSDFQLKDGFRMYHGEVVPGFPRHPHRGFETVTVVRSGLLDHADSMGAGARYGEGDVQWLTAGGGIQHAEMFPLLRRDADNPFELFQIWLNLPRARKMVAPHFSMLWKHTIPRVVRKDDAGRAATVTVMAGNYDGTQAPAAPPDSWASAPDSDLAIWTIELEPAARFTLPAARAGSHRTIYLFEGQGLGAGGFPLAGGHQYDLRAEQALLLENGPARSELLMLQAKPIGEPVARHGPFVMNTRAEIQQAYADYRATRFGGWPWDRPDPVHGSERRRFARHADGKVEDPPA